jgi:hypothetical protein
VVNTAHTWLIVGIIAVVFLLVALVIAIAYVGIIVLSQEESKGATPSAETPINPEIGTPTPETPEPSSGVTLANFNGVETGMTYAEVSEIFGSPGELSMETEILGRKMEIYSWRAATGLGNATISFRDGRVKSKAQFGLK